MLGRSSRLLPRLPGGVKLGSFVANVLNRAPDVLAKTVATVQQISGGRIELGIGAGARPKEQVGFNRPFPAGRERVERVGEAVELIRLMWTGERISYKGKYYSAEGILSTPRPRARAANNGSGAWAEVGEERCEGWGRVELRGASGLGRRGEREVRAAKAHRAGRAGETRTAQGPVRDIHLRQAGRRRSLRSCGATWRGRRRKGSTGSSWISTRPST